MKLQCNSGNTIDYQLSITFTNMLGNKQNHLISSESELKSLIKKTFGDFIYYKEVLKRHLDLWNQFKNEYILEG